MARDDIDVRVRLIGARKFQTEATGTTKAVRNIGTAGDRAGRGLRTVSRESNRSHKALRMVGRGAAYALGAGGFGGGLYALFTVAKRSIGEFRESEKVTRDTAAVIRSMGGASGYTAGQIQELSNSISQRTGVDDEAIQKGQNMLLTFRDVRKEVGKGNDVFGRASKAAVDMSARFDQGLKPSFIQLGKALNDPVKGISALRRVGVQMTESQEDQIKKWVESGQVLKAQKSILKEVEDQTRGSAAAQSTSWEKLQVNLGNLAETIGRGISPGLNKGTRAANKFVREMLSGRGAGGEFVRTLKDIWEAAKPVVLTIGRATRGVARFASRHPEITKLALAVGATGIAVNAIRTSRAVKGLGSIVTVLRTIGRTKAGEQAAASIATHIGGLRGRMKGIGKTLGRGLAAGIVVGVVTSPEFSNWVKSWSKPITDAASGNKPKSSGSGSPFDALKKLWLPAFADGGTAPLGTTALVGERGPEIMQVGSAGTQITPLKPGVNPVMGGANNGPIITKVYLDKRQIAEAVAHQANSEKARR